nr:hypothetical protein [uncultured bacterium]
MAFSGSDETVRPAGERAPGEGTKAALLARPLDLPSVDAGEACPITETPEGFEGAGSGPVYVNTYRGHPFFQDPHEHDMPWYPRGWQLAKTSLYGEADYEGAFTLRGERIDGEGDVRFDLPEFVGDKLPKHLFFPAERRPGSAANLGRWFTTFNTAVESDGCYAYQIDGEGFSEVIVFEAKLES